MEKDMEKEKNIIIMVNYCSKVNILMDQDGMEKKKNIIMVVNYYLKVNIIME